MTEIRISYSAAPRGQVGPRPQPIKLNEVCRFTCAEPGSLTLEFLDESPLGYQKTIEKDVDFVPVKAGRFKFKCILTPPGGKPIVLGDPLDPAAEIGGEIEVGTEQIGAN
jgi:hypothetical protein